MTYKFLEDIAIADIAFDATGKNLNEVFENCALALFECMAKLKTVKAKIKKEINLEEEKLDDLLYNLLEEIIFIKDVESLVFSKVSVNIKKNKTFKLNATIYGDKINQEKQTLKDDVKAITLHMFEIKKTEKGYKARVIVDI